MNIKNIHLSFWLPQSIVDVSRLLPKKISLLISLCAMYFFMMGELGAQQIYINEFMASNASTLADEQGEFDDWLELYNPNATPIDVGGMYLSDDLTNLTIYQIPTTDPAATTIPAGGFLILWLDKDLAQGILHINIKLSSAGEDIVLTAADGTTIIDSYTFGVQLADVSEARVGDGNPTWDLFSQPTPGATNDTNPGAPQADTPTVDVSGGFYSGSVTVTISGNGEIRYTTNGSVPTSSDNLYTAPLTFSENTPLRIVAFDPPALPSKVVTHTYLFDVNTEFAVVSYVADSLELFDPATGMYTNYLDESIEINANAEMWEPDGTLGFNQLFNSEIHGTGSAVYAQKPLALKAKSSLGAAFIPYEVFHDQPGYQPRSLILRNSGQDWNITMFHDAFVSSLVRDLSDVGSVITKPKLHTQGHRPAIAFLNGEYWGINNLRERMDKRYIKAHFGLDDTEIDFLENELEAKEGDFVEWNILKDYLENNSLVSEANLDFVASKIDIDHYLDYVIFNLYIDNQDWPGNNNKRWRERVPNAKWQFMTWDLDFSFGLYIPGQPFNSGIATSNSLARLYQVPNYLWPNPEWATLLFRKLTENDKVRSQFINRMADQINVLYNSARVNARIDEFVDTYDSEIQNHHDRWSSGYQVWNQNVQKLRDFANNRITHLRNHFVQQYSDITGTADITINLNSATNGEVDLNTITVSNVNVPFTGVYFTGVEVPVRAFPDRGYVLSSWSGDLSGNNPSELIDFNGNTNITANFSFGSTSTLPIVINEINYNSPDNNESGDWVELYNPNASTVDMSGWYFEDEGGSFFGFPANTTLAPGAYLVLVEDESLFNTVYPNVNNYIGDFGLEPRGFGLSGGGEQITLKNANGVLIDLVDYDDNSPWPTAADGNGPTLQLIDAALDNALASSWEAKAPTPGMDNNTACIDNDNDGICQAIDCNDNDPNLPTTPGTTCDDNDPNTTNDVIQPDGCTCAGTPVGGNECDNVLITATSNSISIDNINAGHYIIKLFSPTWSTVINCVDCSVPQVATGLTAGIYHADIQLYSATWQHICTLTQDVEVGGAGCTDNDNDGFCADVDCDDNNPLLPTAPGTTCDDNDPNTTNDVIQSDGCTCAGTPVGGNECDNVLITATSNSISIDNINAGHYIIKLFSPTWSTVINCVDCSVPQVATGLTAGIYHADIQLYSATWQHICTLTQDVEVGGAGCTDNDNDGFCADVDCDDNNPLLPTAPGTTCDDNDPNTTNDVIQSDGCTCAGTPISSGTDMGCGVSYTLTSTSITVTGLSGTEHSSLALFDANWQTISTCFNNCDDPLVFDNLATGVYILRLQVWDAGWSRICDVTEAVDLANPNNLEGQQGGAFLFFNAIKDGRTANLNWVTNANGMTDRFIVEKSTDGEVFDELKTIASYNSEAAEMYFQFVDENVAKGDNYYRLRQIFVGGSEHLSQVRKLYFDLDVRSFALFPNPNDGLLYVNMKEYTGEAADLYIYNHLGQVVYTHHIAEVPDWAMLLDLKNLNSGMYHLSVKIKGERLMTRRFVIVK